MIFNKLTNFIDPKDIEIHIYKNGIYIANYTIISHFSSSNIEINKNDKKVIINGKNLIISKLKKDEIFVCGEIHNIDLRSL